MKRLHAVKNAYRLALLAVLAVPTVLSADHLPHSQLVRGKDEMILAGIEIYKTSLDAVFRELGKPTEQRQLSPSTKDVVGERLYKWKRPNISIELTTYFADDLSETPSSIEVKGTDGVVGHTGRGLKLGDPYTVVQKIYGPRYEKKGRHITIQWKTTTTLEIGWNEHGIIDDMVLIGPE